MGRRIRCSNEPFERLKQDGGCGGLGTLYCTCGGDQCVCGWNGEAPCPGCPDCEGDDDGGMPPDFDDDEPTVGLGG